jgi:hypothetical protein
LFVAIPTLPVHLHQLYVVEIGFLPHVRLERVATIPKPDTFPLLYFR